MKTFQDISRHFKTFQDISRHSPGTDVCTFGVPDAESADIRGPRRRKCRHATACEDVPRHPPRAFADILALAPHAFNTSGPREPHFCRHLPRARPKCTTPRPILQTYASGEAETQTLGRRAPQPPPASGLGWWQVRSRWNSTQLSTPGPSMLDVQPRYVCVNARCAIVTHVIILFHI